MYDELLEHPHDGIEHLLVATAGKELLENALSKDVDDVSADADDVSADAEHQPQRSASSDGIVAGLVRCNDAVSDHGHLVQMCDPDGGDQVLVPKYLMEVGRPDCRASVLLPPKT